MIPTNGFCGRAQAEYFLRPALGAALMDGLDWSRLHVHDVAQPSATS
jgi:hypothetical protein